MSCSVEAVPPAAACKRSVRAQCAARPAKAWLEEPIVDLSSRGASAAGPASRKGPAAKRARLENLEMVPQRLEKVQFAPGNGMAPADLDPQYLVQAPAASSAPKNHHRLAPNGRGDERRARRVCLGGVAESWKVARFGAQDVEIARATIDISRLVG